MDLQPTGSKNTIFEIRTNKVTVTILGKSTVNQIPVTSSERGVSSIVFECDNISEVFLDNNEPAVPTIDNSRHGILNYQTKSLFYEQSDYQVVIRSNSGQCGDKIEFWHENYHIRKRVEPISGDESMLIGTINFGNSIGKSDLVIMVGGSRHLKITIEVFPSKIDYKEDYFNILNDINEEVYALVFDFLQKTYDSLKLDKTVAYSPVAFFSILRNIFDDYIKKLWIIVDKPHHKLVKEHPVLPAHKAKHTDSSTIKWLNKHPQHIRKSANGIVVDSVLAVKKKITYNTVENQYIKHILNSTKKRLSEFKHRYINSVSTPDHGIMTEIERMQNDINKNLERTFLSEVDNYSANHSMSLVFAMAPGYRELYKYYLMLIKGLSVEGEIFNLSMKDTALLYEYWCFIKLNNILKKKYQLVSPDIFKVDRNGVIVTLRKGIGSEIKYQNPQTGERVILSYNPGEHATQTVNQRPDNVLSLNKNGEDSPYKYIFDAKYRIDSPNLNQGYPFKSPGPKLDDINTMHRYRDAIVYDEPKPRFGFEKKMFGAYVLFPYSNEIEYMTHPLYESIKKVNIGGLPFLPGSTELVENLLYELIADSPDTAFERASLPRGIEKRIAKVDWKQKDVLVGSLRDTKQLEFNLKENYYYLPKKNINEDRLPIRYIALYQSKGQFSNPGIRYYGEIVQTEICKRKEIPFRVRANPEEDYYRLYVRKWEELTPEIQVQGEGVYTTKYTNYFLLTNCDASFELFQVSSEEEYRLLQELKRVSSELYGGEENKDLSIKINDATLLFVDKGEIRIYKGERLSGKYSINDFSESPGVVFAKIRDHIV
jgi:predicted component of viral defense system (DUF524 family)